MFFHWVRCLIVARDVSFFVEAMEVVFLISTSCCGLLHIFLFPLNIRQWYQTFIYQCVRAILFQHACRLYYGGGSRSRIVILLWVGWVWENATITVLGMVCMYVCILLYGLDLEGERGQGRGWLGG